MAFSLTSSTTIAFLGPHGTYSEQALRSEEDLCRCELISSTTIEAALRAAMSGDVDFAFVPIENSIEGSVSSTLDELIFGDELFIQREVVMDIHIDLLVLPGVTIEEIREVVSYSHALAQVRTYLATHLPMATTHVVNSTADAARIVAESQRRDLAAVAPPITAGIYSLNAIAQSIEDRIANETRFVLVGPARVPSRTGNDRTLIVCFQRADRPGSLHDILGAFSARQVNLTRIESRPTKLALGDYCFVIEIAGHIVDSDVADALRDVHERVANVRFLGSYPVSRSMSPPSSQVVRDGHRESADDWLASLLSHISS